ncbi:hypothetical protein CY35_17G103200 [Sphagnum magellanicum]|nr:hypothetical protein CY35_17G103200 [Sphagnum magellanicum]
MVSSTRDDPVPTLAHMTSPVQGSCPVLAPEDDDPGTYHDQLTDYQASSPALHDYLQRDPVMYQAPGVNQAASSGPADHGYPPPVQLMYQLPGNQASAPVLGYPAPPVLDQNIAMYQGYQAASYQQIPLQQAVVVTGPQYCLPHETTFAISKKVISFSGGDWTITDAASGRKVFKVDGRLFSVRATKHLRDTAGHQILRMQKKFFTIHEGWLVYGNNNQLICTVKRTTPSRIAPELIPSMDVFLASNTTEVVPDFQLKGSFFERSLTLLRRGQVLAQVMRRFTSKNLRFGNESFGVTVSPGGDHAFVLALIFIMDSVYLHSHHHGNNQQLSTAKVTKNLFPMGGGTTFL